MKLLLGTNNQKKLKELREILGETGIEVISMEEAGIAVEVEENGATFIENALLKARELNKLSGLPTLADDSGLVVKALGGAPGVFSARYSGVEGSEKDAANIDKLLRELGSNPEREAYFACAIALVDKDGLEHVVEGQCHGTIGFERKGAYGFGYDPVFVVSGFNGKTMAELPPETKNEISHRGNALKKIKKVLEQI